MVAQYERHYGAIRFTRRGHEHGYRADDQYGNLIGYYLTLHAATSAAHRRYLDSLVPGGAINGS
ncbi:MAG: hypothetical protein KF692_07530 [Cryobacterium sp.]|mgnify:CR=1 FL=1|nr:hypothetical protein [Cryobacterium sp.]